MHQNQGRLLLHKYYFDICRKTNIAKKSVLQCLLHMTHGEKQQCISRQNLHSQVLKGFERNLRVFSLVIRSVKFLHWSQNKYCKKKGVFQRLLHMTFGEKQNSSQVLKGFDGNLRAA